VRVQKAVSYKCCCTHAVALLQFNTELEAVQRQQLVARLKKLHGTLRAEATRDSLQVIPTAMHSLHGQLAFLCVVCAAGSLALSAIAMLLKQVHRLV
jgi:hypothetical protein